MQHTRHIQNIDIIYKSVKTSSGSVGYAVIGHGPAFVLVVGYTGTLFHWNSEFVLELAKYYTVYLIDNRMIGLSQSTNQVSTLGFALDVKDFIESMSLKKPFVLGWSMGGTIVQELASFYNHNLSGIILMASLSHPKYTNPDFIALLQNAEKFKGNPFRERLYFFFFSEPSSFRLKDYLTKSALKFSNYNYRFSPEAKNLQDRVITSWAGMDSDRLAKLDLPVLVLWAVNDLVVSEAAQDIFLQKIPQVKLNTYLDGGHFLIHAHPHQIVADITKYFNQ
jgi:pimeloyl-ACP methyl ester carboxylesterase